MVAGAVGVRLPESDSWESSPGAVTLIAPHGAAVVELADSHGVTVGVSFTVPASPSEERDHAAAMYEVLVFLVGASSPSEELARAGTIELTLVSAIDLHLVDVPAENRILDVPPEPRVLEAA
jgi:hypothetical protein